MDVRLKHGRARNEVKSGTVTHLFSHRKNRWLSPLSRFYKALVDGGGLGRLRFDVAAGVEGVFPVTLVDLTTDPNFGTGVIDGQFNPLPIEVRSGSITVVIPEPSLGAIVVIGMTRARRRGG